jgi:hypothetical protein
MLSFVQQILAFATFEVLEPNWRALESKLEKVTTVDQLLRDHVDFLDTCLKECMLTSSRLLKVCLLCQLSGNCVVDHTPLGIFKADSDMFNVCIVYIFVYEISAPSHGRSERR